MAELALGGAATVQLACALYIAPYTARCAPHCARLIAGPAGARAREDCARARDALRGKPAGAREAVGLADRFVSQNHDPDRSFEEMATLFGLVGAAAQRG